MTLLTGLTSNIVVYYFKLKHSLLTLVQHKSSGVVFGRHGDHGVAVVGYGTALVHCVPSNGGCRVTGPVECVPTPMVRQTLY